MRQVRRGVFETNSSSTHSLTICTQEEFDKWLRGEVMFDTYDEKLVKVNITMSDADKKFAQEYYDDQKKTFWKSWDQLSTEEIEAWYEKYLTDYDKLDAYRYQTRNKFLYDGSGLESFTQHYTSPSGDKLVAFGKYGYN